MFNLSLISLNLLDPDDATGFLKNYSLPSRREIIGNVVKEITTIMNAEQLANTFSKASNIEWHMEIVGQAFALPLDTDKDFEIVNGAYDIYLSWLCPAEAKKAIAYKKKFPVDSKDIKGGAYVPSFLVNPKDDIETANIFYRKIFDHFTLLFTERKLKEKYFEDHAALCENVLLLFEKLAAQETALGPKGALFTEATWKRLLRLLIGITQSLLSPDKKESVYGTFACDTLARVLLGVWIESKTKDTELWNHLKKCLRAIRNRETVILQWDACLYGLTNKVLQILWKTEGKYIVLVEWVSWQATTYKMEDKDVIFFWYQFLMLIGKLNNIENPIAQWYAVQACTKVADLFNDIGGVLKNDILDVSLAPHRHPSLTDAPLIPIVKKKSGSVVSNPSSLTLTPELSDKEKKSNMSINFRKVNFSGSRSPGRSPVNSNSSTPSKSDSPVKEAFVSNPAHHSTVNNLKEIKQLNVSLAKLEGVDFAGAMERVMSPSTGLIREKMPDDNNDALIDYKKEITAASIKVGPDVDSILSIIGTWLFEAAMNEKVSFAPGRAEALGCLGRLFCGRSFRTRLKIENSMQFFSVVKLALSQEVTTKDFDPQPLEALLLNCNNIFSTGLVGVSILLPDFLKAVKTILLGPNGSNKEYLATLQQRDALADARRQEFDWVQISGNSISKMDSSSAKFWKAPTDNSTNKFRNIGIINPSDEWSSWGRQERRNIPFLEYMDTRSVGGVPTELLRRSASKLLNSISCVPPHFLYRYDNSKFDSDQTVSVVKALFKFIAIDGADLSLEKDDIVHVIRKELPDSDEWWIGRIDDRVGCFPANYVEEIKDENILKEIANNNLNKKKNPSSFRNASVLMVEEKIEGITNQTINNYREINNYIGKVLIESFKGESDPINIQILLWSIYTMACEHGYNIREKMSIIAPENLHKVLGPSTSSLIVSIYTISNSLLDPTQCTWPISVSITAIEVLLLFSELYNEIEVSDNTFPRTLVRRLLIYCSYHLVNARKRADKKIARDSDILCSHAMHALISWLLVLPPSHFSTKLIHNISNFAILAADKKKTAKPMLLGIDNNIRKAGQLLLSYLMKISLFNPLAKPHFYDENEEKFDKKVKSFIIQDKIILTIKEVYDNEKDRRKCVLFARDSLSKWSWTINENVSASKSNVVVPFSSTVSAPKKIELPTSTSINTLPTINVASISTVSSTSSTTITTTLNNNNNNIKGDQLDNLMAKNKDSLLGNYDGNFLETEDFASIFTPTSPNMQFR